MYNKYRTLKRFSYDEYDRVLLNMFKFSHLGKLSIREFEIFWQAGNENYCLHLREVNAATELAN